MPQLKFTDRTLRSLKLPERGQVDFYDIDRASPHGFGVRASHTGTRTFFVKYVEPDGFGGTRQKRKMLKTDAGVNARYPDVPLADARELGFTFRRKVASGGASHDGGPRLPFSVLVTHYIDNHAEPKKRSWKEDKRILNKYFKDWHQRPAEAITTAEIVERVHKIKKENGPIMANRALAALRMAIKYAIQNPPKNSKGETYAPLPYNPARDVSAPGDEQEADRVFTDKELKALWQTFDALGTAGAIYKLALITGQRINEVRWLCDAELEDDVWGVPSSRTKNKRFHIVPLTRLAKEIISEQQKARAENADLVFPSIKTDGVPVTLGTKVAEDVRGKSGVKDFSAHHLRRTVATGITKLGFGHRTTIEAGPLAQYAFHKSPRCGARTRAGHPCRSPAMPNGRCRMHGGPSTGPKTPEGKARQRQAVTTHGMYAGLDHPDFGHAAGPKWRGHRKYRKQLREAIKWLDEYYADE